MGKAEDFRKAPVKDRKDDGRGGTMPGPGQPLDVPKKGQWQKDAKTDGPDGRTH